VKVHSAALQDRDGISLVVTEEIKQQYPRLELIYLDKGYRGKGVRHLESLGLKGEVVTHKEDREIHILAKHESIPKRTGFKILPKRWVVERCFAWYSLCRRLSKDYELQQKTTEAWIYLSAAMLIMNRWHY
jgi:putative transposase